MKSRLKSRQTEPSFQINWKIREIFSDEALACFFDEIDNKSLEIEQNKKYL